MTFSAGKHKLSARTSFPLFSQKSDRVPGTEKDGSGRSWSAFNGHGLDLLIKMSSPWVNPLGKLLGVDG